MPGSYELEPDLDLKAAMRLAQDPDYRGAMRALTFLWVAFGGAGVAYAGILATGVLRPLVAAPREGGFPLWAILPILALGALPLPMVLIPLKYRAARRAGGFYAARREVMVMMALALALGEAAGIFGLLSPLLGAPPAVSWILIAASLAALLGFGAMARARASDALLRRLEAEERARGAASPAAAAPQPYRRASR